MFTPLTISGLVVGIVFMWVGAVLIVLSYTTKLFYTRTKVSTAAGDSIADGRAIVDNADVAWDETGIVLDSTGKFVKWTSTKLYSDTVGGTSYSYDLAPEYVQAVLTTQKSNTGLLGIYNNGLNPYNHMTNIRTVTQKWTSFPRYENDTTVIFAFSCPSGGGMSFWHQSDVQTPFCGHRYNTQTNTSQNTMNPISNTYVSSPFDSIQTYTTTSYGTLSSNVSAFSYMYNTNVYATYFNGKPYPLIQPSTLPPISKMVPADNQPKLVVGKTTTNYMATPDYAGTIYAAYVFSRVLSQTEVSSVSSYLQQKYFAPLLQYPSYVYASINNPCSLQNTLVPNAAPIISYSISPSLPAGLTLDTTTGVISGTPTEQSRSTPYTITATNAIASSTADIYIRMDQTTQDKNGVVPPNITLSYKSASVIIGGSVSSPLPVNTGGTVTSFSIQPTLTDPGLKFDTGTGVLSGIPTINATTIFTITANNDGGLATTTFRLQVGTSISYPDSIHGKVGTAITPLIPALTSVDGASVDITAYTCTGDLHDLTFNQSTGIISGTPTTSGVNELSVTATMGATSIKTQIPLSIVDSTEFKNKYAYIGAGGAAVAAGAALVGTACFYGLDWKSSRIPVPPADISSNAPA